MTTVATSGGQTFQITGTSMGGKVLHAKLPLPANSKFVTVNVPTTQGGRPRPPFTRENSIAVPELYSGPP